MDVVAQFLQNTPWWVYVLFFYLLSRGLAARKPGEVSLGKLAIIPVALTAWSLAELVRLYGLQPSAIAIWLVGLLVGIIFGWLLLRTMAITVDPATGVIHRPADFTLLPLILVTFGVKYAFGAIAATAPDLLQEPMFKLADLGLSGLFSGIFVGKFALYASRYRAARS
ncbi:MAG: hypothetical protein JNK47_05645 [Mesorhizobium sp.]|nr:hypothetical protein [Mesorhizobium sp.]MBL8576687.1 hypothetical protein [Mesorhizobium sp.]